MCPSFYEKRSVFLFVTVLSQTNLSKLRINALSNGNGLICQLLRCLSTKFSSNIISIGGQGYIDINVANRIVSNQKPFCVQLLQFVLNDVKNGVIWFQERSPCKVPDPVWRSYHRMHELEKLPAGNVEVTRRNKL